MHPRHRHRTNLPRRRPRPPAWGGARPSRLRSWTIPWGADPQGTQMAWAPARVAFAEDRVATVSVPLAARVVSVRAHVGDIVKAGDELATLVSPEALRVRYEVEAARSAHDVATVEVRRQQTMVDKGVGVEVDLRAAQAKLRESAQELARAQGTSALLGQGGGDRSEEHTSELQSHSDLVCRLLLEKKNITSPSYNLQHLRA